LRRRRRPPLLHRFSVGDPEKEIIGKWQYTSTFGLHLHAGPVPTLEFKEDGVLLFDTGNRSIRNDNGRWKVVSKQGANMTVDVTYTLVHVHPNQDMAFPPTTETWYLTVHRRNELRRRFKADSTGGLRYKRI
jgi:hypothetical protein